MKIANKLNQLTGLRYFAALLVFLSHLKWSGSSEILVKIFESGYVGVSFFFLLSGFVLSHSYKERILDKSLSCFKYILLRLARLTPLHFLTALPFILLATYKADINIFKAIVNLSYLQSWIPSSSYYFSFNAPSWSLSNEMFFYFCFFPLVFLNTKNLVKIFLALLLTILTSALFFTTQLSGLKLFGGNTLAHWLFYIFPGFRILEFIAGMLIFQLWKTGYRLPHWVTSASYILLITSMYFANQIPEPFRLSLYFIPFVSLFFYANLTEDTPSYRLFSTKYLTLLGNASFAFYLIHQPLINILERLTQKYNLSYLPFFILCLSVATLASIFIYIFYEKKAESFLKNYISNKIQNQTILATKANH
ncbi:acyltransferase family protein [Chromobacterium sinusclupearum]|nr:acyltransferase [Chromobacterium sinusclupearum]